MSIVVGLDVGTQGVKLVALDVLQRRIVATHGQPLRLLAGDDGSREQLPSGGWPPFVGASQRSIRRCAPASLRSACQGSSMASCRSMRPARCWHRPSCGATPAPRPSASRSWPRSAARRACIALAGNPDPGRLHRLEAAVDAQAPARGLRAPGHDPAAARLPQFLAHRPARFCEYGDASGTGWLDVRTRELVAGDAARRPIRDRDLADCLPPLVARRCRCSRSHRVDRVGRWACRAGVRVAAGGGDNMMAAIGTGSVAPGRLAMSLGTSGTLFAYSDTPVVDADRRAGPRSVRRPAAGCR